MSGRTEIAWTDHTFNTHWGCFKVSEGCQNCYAETFAKRTGHAIWGPPKTTGRRLFGPKHWADPLKWNRQAEQEGRRHRVFCNSMSDVFEDHPDVATARRDLFAVIHDTPMLDWQLLTKRPENVRDMVPWERDWPENVWLGTSVEHQAAAEQRIPILLSIPAKVRFLSCEPLLGPVTLFGDEDEPGGVGLIGEPYRTWTDYGYEYDVSYEPGVDWVIVGAESGPKRRPFDIRWAMSLRDQCANWDVAFFYKQGSDLYPGRHRLLDGRTWDEFPREAVLS